MRWPDMQERPAGNPGALKAADEVGYIIPDSVAASAVIPRPRAVCWRCGVPFAWTTVEVLRRCAELARSAS